MVKADSTSAIRKLIFLTRSTDRMALAGRYNTASQSYEVGLIGALSKQAEVNVVYIGSKQENCNGVNTTYHASVVNGDKIHYIYFGKIKFFNLLKSIYFFKMLSNAVPTVILTTGYHPWEILILAFLRSKNTATFSIVFDTHVQGNSRMRRLKKFLADMYFESGYRLLHHLNGLIVLNDIFVKKDKRAFRYLKSKVGSSTNFHSAVECIIPKSSKIRVLFAGTLNRENGVSIMLDFLALDKRTNLEVTFAGYGELAEHVSAVAAEDSRTRFVGPLSDKELSLEIAKSDMVICFRDPESYVNNFAFPSKLIKLMSSGIPVISNKFPGLDEKYFPHLLLIDDFSAAALVRKFKDLKLSDAKLVGNSAKIYVERHHQWSEIADDILNFMFDDLSTQTGA